MSASLPALQEQALATCPKCGGTMKIVGLIEEENVIEKILRHCKLWKDAPARSPPVKSIEHLATLEDESQLDYDFFSQNCI